MHAMFVTVDIEAGSADESVKVLHEFTVPAAKAQEGFVRGVWFRSSDQTEGHGLVLFDTEDHARAAAALARQGPPAGAPVKIRSVETFEVMAEA